MDSARNLPESGYSQISGDSCVLTDRYFSGAPDVLMDLVRVLRAGGIEHNITRTQRQHLACHAQCSFAFDNNEHLFLRMMKMVGAPRLPGASVIDSAPQLTSRRFREPDGHHEES